MFGDIFRHEKVEMIPTFSWRDISLQIKTNQLSYLQRIRRPFRLVEIRLKEEKIEF